MAFNSIFKGYPPEHIRTWYIDNMPTTDGQTTVTYLSNGIERQLSVTLSGFVDKDTLYAANVNLTSEGVEVTGLKFGTDVSVVLSGGFQDMTSLVSVELPSTLKNIGDGSFYNTGINQIIVPNETMYLGVSSFSYCSSLMYARVNGVSKINNSTFANSSISDVVIGSSVQTIGQYAFNKTKLQHLTVPANVKSIEHHAFYSTGELTSIDFNEGLKNIGNYAFNACGVLNIKFPNSLTCISDYAFYGCTNLTAVEFGDEILSVNSYALGSCNNLKYVKFPSLQALCQTSFGGVYSNGMYYAKTMYIGENGDQLSDELILPDDIQRIGSYAFSNCKMLSNVIISNAEVIDNYAFNGCNGLTSVVFGKNLKLINSNAFRNAKNLLTVTFNDCSAQILNHAFDDCQSLEHVDFGGNVTYIGAQAFDGTKLSSVELPSALTYIGTQAFYETKLSSVELPSALTYIEAQAFSRTNLTAVYISDLPAWCNISYSNNDSNPLLIAHNLYLNGELLTSFSTPSNLSKIKDYCFHGCHSLENVVINEGVSAISQYAFNGCSCLNSISLPSTLTNIGSYAFGGCSSLLSVTFAGNRPQSIQGYAFYHLNGFTIYVNHGTDWENSYTVPGLIGSFSSASNVSIDYIS